jgi:hypothetical protein
MITTRLAYHYEIQLLTDGIPPCDAASQWELCATMANVVTPGSTVAPATFIDVVFKGQQKRQHIQLDGTEQYLSLLENLGYLCHSLDTGEIRRAYKYARRTLQAFSLLVGKPMPFVLTIEIENQLRQDQTAHTLQLHQEIIHQVVDYLFPFLLSCAPPIVRFVVV